ncbi:pentatricopeptide repeat (PPR) superfamily protein [Actinidia rufa]|uniref:Pentatricopeptide repeat (PPR) superfamily protein n=1 Tax=Actinidia rufa TaxID=165716 RepID=A0A7J0F6B5_9ERIC|nr:pentatricopeptide repeat (PPR) superfamily protein [Actinidia rufa]
MISGFAKLDRAYEAVEIFSEMRSSGIEPNEFSFVAILTACIRNLDLELGFQVHSLAIKTGYLDHTFVSNALMGLYITCGCLDFVLEVFDKMPQREIASWNTVLTGVVKESMNDRALGIELTDFTLTSVISACGLLMDVKISEQVHVVLKFSFRSNDCIKSALLDMYTKCGRMADAEEMFYQVPGNQNNGVMRTSMICGKQIHSLATKMGLISDIGVGNAAISMYYKCGNMENALKVFNMMSIRDIVAWNNLMAGYLLHLQGNEVLDLRSKMEKAGQQPDSLTFLWIIAAYRHSNANLLDNCRRLFLAMKTPYDIEPTSEHYAAFIGVLDYWELLEEAE